MSDANMNANVVNSLVGDGDSLRSCDEGRDAETRATKSVSWKDQNNNDAPARGSTDDALHIKSIGVGMLPTSDGADCFSDNVEKHPTNDAEMPRSEKDGDNNKSLPSGGANDGGGREATAGEGQRGENDLPPDSFSMLFVAESPLEHGLPLLVFGLQMLILVLLMINLLQTSDRPLVTTMNVPVDVPMTVKISQYIACIVSVFTADDLVSGALLVGRRVVKKGLVDVERERLLATGDLRQSVMVRSISAEVDRSSKRHWKWELANAMRITEGALVVVVAFIFIVQSVTAIDLWLNFAGVSFVGMIDDTAYHLARNQFLGVAATHLANRVSDFEVYSEGRRQRKAMRRIRLALFVGIGVAMWAGLSVFVYNQAKLTYACSSVTLWVGENRHQAARFFSGHYRIQEKTINGRAVYVQNQGRGAFIAYCAADQINRWTISPLNNDEEPNDPCRNIIMQSQRTKTHDISEVGDSLLFWTGDIADAYIKCNQCNPGRSGDCSYRGVCDEEVRLCNCDRGFFGDSCQFSGPCTELVMHDAFPGVYTHAYQKSWDLMYLDERPVMVYNRPVYVQSIEQDVFYVMMFDGGRWFVAQSNYFVDWYNSYSGRERADDSLANYLIQSFNARVSEYIASYIAAEPSISGSPSNVPFRAWLTEASRISSNIGRLGDDEYTAFCADCTDEESALLATCVGSWGEPEYSLCKSTESDIHGMVKRCECLPGFSGPLCHRRPVEGTAGLHLDHSSGTCSTCFVGNPWTVWDLEGIAVQCESIGKLFFEDGNEIFSRELGLHLNSSHFSVFVSSTHDTIETLCQTKEGTEEVYAAKRDGMNGHILVDAVIHLDNRKESWGEVVGPEGVNCRTSMEVFHDMCYTSLAEVFSAPDMKSSLLKHAWLQLDLKVTSSSQVLEDAAPPVASPTISTNETSSSYETFLSNNGASNTNMASATAKSYTFAVIPKDTTNPFFFPVKSGCEERAAALSRQSVRGSVSVECFFVGPMVDNATEQARIANDLIGSVDGIAMAVIDEILAADVAKNAFAAGIPFITFDSNAPSTNRAASVGTNNTALGQELGMLLLIRFASSGTYAIISDDSTNTLRREVGIRDVLNRADWKEVPVSPLHVGDKPIEQMYNLMNAHPDLTAMLLTFGGVMLAGEEREWETFVQEHPDLILLSADSMPVQFDLLNRGFANGLVGQQPADMGSKSIDTLLSLSKGHEVDEFIHSSLLVMARINEDNPYNQLDLTSSNETAILSNNSTLDADGMPDRVESNAPPAALPPTSSNKVPSTENSPAQTENSTILSSNGASNVACATSESYTFAVIPKSTTNSFFFPVQSGCEERAAALSRPSVRGSVSVSCLYVGPTNESAIDQARIANDLIGSVDGIAMAVIDEALASDVAKNALAAGVPFITFDSDAPSTERAAYVGTNNTALGQELGLLLLTRFATSGSYVIVSSDDRGPNLFLREAGVRQVLNAHGWKEATSSPLYTWEGNSMYDLVNRHPDLTAMVFTVGDVMRTSEGEWKSFAQEHPDLILLAVDATPVQMDFLNGGFVDGLVGQQPADMGSISIDTLLSLSKGHEVDEFITTSLIVMGRVNEDNPYNQLGLTSAAIVMGSAASLLLLLAMLALFAAAIA